MNNELYHYGVLGMKWGVRRYQKADGSYTKAGLKRYNRSLDEYEAARQKLKESKSSGDKSAVRAAKGNVKVAKRQLNKNYKQLSRDHLADKGKRLYQQGKTITDSTRVTALAQSGIVFGAGVTQRLLASYGNVKAANIASTTVGVGGSVVNAILAAKNANERKQLRAYYSHGR